MEELNEENEKEKSKPGAMKYVFSFLAILLFVFGVVLIINITGKDEGVVSEDSRQTGDFSQGDVIDETGDMTVQEPEEILIEDLMIGEGAEATPGASLTVNYLGTLTDGTKFDSSYDRDAPFTFILGQGMVIEGWDIGVQGMKVGGKRKLTIPPELAYGDRGAGDLIPPGSTLVFEIELLEVE